jgi:hypothetical protein
MNNNDETYNQDLNFLNLKSNLSPKEAMQNPLAWWDRTHEKASVLARWIALYEAVNLIADKAEEKGQLLEDIQFKPLAIYDYMQATENITLKKILKELYKIQICYSEENSEFKNLVDDMETV